jgi:hypothetical protein
VTSRPRRPLDPGSDERARTSGAAAPANDDGARGSRPAPPASDDDEPASHPAPRSSHDPAPANDLAPPPSSEHARARAAHAPAPPPGEPRSRVHAALMALLAGRSEDDGYGFIRAAVVRKLHGKRPEEVDETLVDDIAGTALESALTEVDGAPCERP